MADKPPLVTKWGGPAPSHPPLITAPANPERDLTLTSEVLVQSFLSLQKHEYTYRVDNGTQGHALRVQWKAPQIKLERAAKGETPIRNESFFSPQLVKTTASAEALADETPFAGKASQDARADAYVPWQSALAKSLKALLGEAIAKKLTFSNAASVAIAGGVAIAVTSQLGLAENGFEYRLLFENKGQIPAKVDVANLQFGNEPVEFDLAPSERKELVHRTSDVPSERQVLVKIAGQCEFPIYVLVAENMMEADIRSRIALAPKEEDTKTEKKAKEEKKRKVEEFA
jgi:hypothetical protein